MGYAGLYWDDGMNLGISPPDFSFGDRISFFMGVGFGGGMHALSKAHLCTRV